MTDPTPSNDPAREAMDKSDPKDVAAFEAWWTANKNRWLGLKVAAGAAWLAALAYARTGTPASPDAHMPPIARDEVVYAAESLLSHLRAIAYRDSAEYRIQPGHPWFDALDSALSAAPYLTPANPAAVLTEEEREAVALGKQLDQRSADNSEVYLTPYDMNRNNLLAIIDRIAPTEGAKP